MCVIDVAVQVVMVHDRMDFAPVQVLCGPPEHFLRRTVHKGAFALCVDAIDAFAGGIQDQLVLSFQLGEETFGALPGRQARAMEVCRFGGLFVTVKFVQINQGQQQRLAFIRKRPPKFTAEGFARA